MSVVVAIKENNKIYLGADTLAVLGESKRHLKNADAQKIWAVKDIPNCIMGGVGFFRDINLVHHCTYELIPEANILKGELDMGIVMTYAVPQIYNTIREYSKAVQNKDNEEGSSFLLAHKDKCFIIMSDGYVEEVTDYEAIGSGADAALASLAHTEGLPVYERMLMALEAAAEISLFVDGPFVVIDTENTNLDWIVGDEAEEIDGPEENDEPKEKQTANENIAIADEVKETIEVKSLLGD